MADIRVIDQGTIVQFVPETDGGREFLQNDVESESWQWMGTALCVDHRCAGGLIDACLENGLELKA